jgi:hypothetical protein
MRIFNPNIFFLYNIKNGSIIKGYVKYIFIISAWPIYFTSDNLDFYHYVNGKLVNNSYSNFEFGIINLVNKFKSVNKQVIFVSLRVFLNVKKLFNINIYHIHSRRGYFVFRFLKLEKSLLLLLLFRVCSHNFYLRINC